MAQLKVDLVKKAKRPGYAMKPEYITIHDTANKGKGANAKAHNTFVHNNAPNPSWHFSVDDKIVYQHLPLTENGWHAGDGTNGTGNRKSIGIEICENSDGNRAKAEANAAWLVAKLIREVKTLKPFPACMKQHYDWSGKNCPAQIRARKNGWKNFLAAVERHLKGSEMPSITKAIAVHVGGKATKEAGYLIDNATYIRASYYAGLVGGTVTGHGDYIQITLPKAVTAEQERLAAELTAAKTALTAAKSELAAVKKELLAAKAVIVDVRKAVG